MPTSTVSHKGKCLEAVALRSSISMEELTFQTFTSFELVLGFFFFFLIFDFWNGKKKKKEIIYVSLYFGKDRGWRLGE